MSTLDPSKNVPNNNSNDESVNLPPEPYTLPRCAVDRRGILQRRPSWIRQLEQFFVNIRPYFQLFQWVALFIFFGLVFLPVFLPEPPESATPFNNITEFANYAMWGIWFPLVLLSVLVSGRSWCGLFCPQGAASEWLNKIGPQKTVPRWMRWEGLPIVSFLLVTLLGQTLGVRDHPEAIVELFGGTLLGAMIVGYLYARNQRAWCRHLCPIGLLLGIFSRLGSVYFVYSKKRDGGDRYSTKGLCPTMVDIRYKEESRHCIVCFRCISPGTRNSVFFQLRRPGIEVEHIKNFHPNLSEALFLFLGTGIALGGFLWLGLAEYQEFRLSMGMWFFDHGMFWAGDAGPSWLMSVHPQRGEVFSWIDFFSILSFMLGVMGLLTLTLSATTAAAAKLSNLLGEKNPFKSNFNELAYQYAPIALISLILGLGAELFKALYWVGLDTNQIGYIKLGIFYLSLLWSVWIGFKILGDQGVHWKWRWIPMLPGLLGSVLVGMAWKIAIF